MKDERIIEEMAKLDGLERTVDTNYPWRNIRDNVLLHMSAGDPRYLNSHDAVQRVIECLDEDTYYKYIEALDSMFEDCPVNIFKANPRQKCEAILRAVGRWEG